MNAFDLLIKFIKETEKSFQQAKTEGNFWRAQGLRRLYNSLILLKDKF